MSGHVFIKLGLCRWTPLDLQCKYDFDICYTSLFPRSVVFSSLERLEVELDPI